MHLTRSKITRRSQTRIPGVLPVRVRGKEASGARFEALAHTLDLTPTGVRLGAIRRELKRSIRWSSYSANAASSSP